MTTPTLPGIHHITAIAGDPQRNVDFYSGVLGLRLVKKTVNFEDPQSYHLYYGDALGRPGTIMTFFAWPGAPRGRVSPGEVGTTAFAIPAAALPYWQDRLASHGVATAAPIARFGDQVLAFADPDGLPLELIAGPQPDVRPGWTESDIPVDAVIRGFHAPTLLLTRTEPSARLLTEVMGFRAVATEAGRTRYAAGDGTPGSTVDLLVAGGAPGDMGTGVVHHIAWRTSDSANQLAWQHLLAEQGMSVTEVRDRQYFTSIYYREPGGVLYEIATDEPGFAVDETPAALGTAFKLPPWLEQYRARLEAALPPIHEPERPLEAQR